MRGISPGEIPSFVARDVEMVKKEAKVIIHVSQTRVKNAWNNPNGRLGVIAIIGPGEFQGKTYGEVVLCEVGIGKSRPYHESGKPSGSFGNGETRKISSRKKWFSLAQEQYLAVSPILFLVFQKLTNEKVKSWKHGFFSDDPFLIPTARNYFSRHQKKVFSVNSHKPQPSGTRFAVSLNDLLLARDIFWAEFNNSFTVYRLKGLARFLDLYLSWLNGGKGPIMKVSKKREENIWKSLGPLSSKSPHLVPELLAYLPKRRLAFSYISDLIRNSSETFERKLANSALLNPEARLNGISIRITTGLGKRDHIVFEVAPKYSD